MLGGVVSGVKAGHLPLKYICYGLVKKGAEKIKEVRPD